MASETNQRRTQLLQRRKAMTSESAQHLSVQACTRLLTLSEYKNANTIAAYIASNCETDPMHMVKQALADDKQIYMPVVKSGYQLNFAPFDLNSKMATNQFSIQEPVCDPATHTTANLLDIIIVPLVGFDAKGNRIGMGAGYYDRALASEQDKSPVKIGFAYEWQRLAELVPNSWDVPMDIIVTDKTIYAPQSDKPQPSTS